MGGDLPSPSLAVTSGRVAALSLLHLRFAWGVIGDADLPTVWEEVVLVKGLTEGPTTLNQALLRGILYCQRVFGGREQFSASLPLLEFVNILYLTNTYLEPA